VIANKKFSSAVAGIVMGMLVSTLFAQDEGELNRQIRSVKEEIAREKELHQQEKERDQAFKVSAQERLKKISEERTALSAQVDSLEVERKRSETLRQKQKSTARWYSKRHDDHSKFLITYVDSLISFVEKDIPYNREERIRSLRSLRELLQNGSISPEEGTDRIWSTLLSLLKVGGSVENWPGTLGSTPGKYLRLGAVFIAFISDDGREIQTLAQTKEGWKWSSVGDDLELRAALRDALKVSEGKTAPALVLLPVDGTLLGDAQSIGGKK